MTTDDMPSKEQVLILHDGDLTQTVRMLAAARRIRAYHPKARVTLLCGPDFEGLLKHCVYFNAVEPTLPDLAQKGFSSGANWPGRASSMSSTILMAAMRPRRCGAR